MEKIAETKTCRDCKATKPIEDFYRKSATRREGRCIPCFRRWRGVPEERRHSMIDRRKLHHLGLRPCCACKQTLPLESFSKLRCGKIAAACRPCSAAAVALRRPTSGIRKRNAALREQGQKLCGRCQHPKAFADFGPAVRRPDGLSAYCRECVNAYSSERYRVDLDASRENRRAYSRNDPKTRARQKAQFDANPQQNRAQQALRRAVKAGRILRPSSCSRCGDTHRVEAHHDSYARPLDVMWLCTACHRARHKELRAAGIVP